MMAAGFGWFSDFPSFYVLVANRKERNSVGLPLVFLFLLVQELLIGFGIDKQGIVKPLRQKNTNFEGDASSAFFVALQLE